MVGTPIDAATLNVAHGVGVIPPMRLESEELASVPENTQEFWENGLAKMEAAHHELVAVLQDMSTEHDCYQSVAIEWVDRVSTQSLEEVPMNLQEHCRLYDDDRLATLAFSHRVHPPRTKWPPPLPRQMPPPAAGLALPRSIHDILLPWAYRLRKRWYS